MEKVDVLLFGTMGMIGPMVRESLVRHGLSVLLVDFPQHRFRDLQGYRRILKKTLAEYSPSVIMPIGHPLAMAMLNETDASLLENTAVTVETSEKIRLLDSKVDCSALATSLGIRQPRFFNGPQQVEAYPVIFKRDSSFGGSGVYKPESPQALRRLMEHEPGRRFLIEELIQGQDYSVDCIRYGDFFKAGCYRCTATYGQNGPATEREAVEFPELCSVGRRILDAIDYNGICGMDFRVSPYGTPYFLECNPRFTGGIGLQASSGFDQPWLLYLCASGNIPEI